MLNYFYRRIYRQKDAFISLTTLAVIAAVATCVTLYAYGEQAWKDNPKVEVVKYSNEFAGEGDSAHEDTLRSRSALVKTMVEGGKLAVKGSSGDDTMLAGIAADYLLDMKSEKKEQQETKINQEIRETLVDNNLPSEPLDVGIARIVQRKVEMSSEPGTDKVEIGFNTVEIIQAMKEKEIQFDIAKNNSGVSKEVTDYIGINMGLIVNTTLEANNILADEATIEKKKELERKKISTEYDKNLLSAYEEFANNGFLDPDPDKIFQIEEKIEKEEQEILQLESEILEQETVEDEGNTVVLPAEDEIDTVREDITDQLEEDGISELDEDIAVEEDIEEPAETVETITLSGTIEWGPYTAGFDKTISLIINMETGVVFGSINGVGGGYFEGFMFTSTISGNIDLDTYEIFALCDTNVTGSAIYADEYNTFDGKVYDDVPVALSGTLSEDKLSASGKTDLGNSWNASI